MIKITESLTIDPDQVVVVNGLMINDKMIAALSSLVTLDNRSKSITSLAQDFLFARLNKDDNRNNTVSVNTILLGIELMGLISEYDDIHDSIRKVHPIGSISDFVGEKFD